MCVCMCVCGVNIIIILSAYHTQLGFPGDCLFRNVVHLFKCNVKHAMVLCVYTVCVLQLHVILQDVYRAR